MKVLVEELQAASGARRELSAADIEKFDDEGESGDDGDWEDDPDGILNLGLGGTKAELMAFAEESPYAARQRDDETQAYLIQFFHDVASKPGFAEIFGSLSGEEQEKLRSYG